jgi:hypothetical protein
MKYLLYFIIFFCISFSGKLKLKLGYNIRKLKLKYNIRFDLAHVLILFEFYTDIEGLNHQLMVWTFYA